MVNQHRCMAFKDRSRSSTLDRVAYVRGRVRNGDEINSVLYLMTDGIDTDEHAQVRKYTETAPYPGEWGRKNQAPTRCDRKGHH